MNMIGPESPHDEVVKSVLQERHAALPITDEVTLTMVCMDTRPGDPDCAILANDHTLNLARHPGGLSGASRRTSGAWAADDPEGYKEHSEAAHLNGLRLVEPLGQLGITPIIHFGCKDNAVAARAAALVADKDQTVFAIAQEMDPSLTRKTFAKIADGQALMLDLGHIADANTIVDDYVAHGVPIATLHGPELRGISLVDNQSKRPVVAPPKRNTPEYDNRAIYVTDTGLVIPGLAQAARRGLSNQIQEATVHAADTIHKATLVAMLDLPYVAVT